MHDQVGDEAFADDRVFIFVEFAANPIGKVTFVECTAELVIKLVAEKLGRTCPPW